jgi:hypothetical protein
MRELLLKEKRLVGRRELFKNRAKFTAKSFYSAASGFSGRLEVSYAEIHRNATESVHENEGNRELLLRKSKP